MKIVRSNVKQPKLSQQKILPGNGKHLARGKIQGIIQKTQPNDPIETPEKILLLGAEFPCVVANKLAFFRKRNPQALEGIQNYVVYPRTDKSGKIVRLVVNVVKNDQKFTKESWDIIGLWHPKKFIQVQRSEAIVGLDRIHSYNLNVRFHDQNYQQQLWAGNCYQFSCERVNNFLVVNQHQLVTNHKSS